MNKYKTILEWSLGVRRHLSHIRCENMKERPLLCSLALAMWDAISQTHQRINGFLVGRRKSNMEKVWSERWNGLRIYRKVTKCQRPPTVPGKVFCFLTYPLMGAPRGHQEREKLKTKIRVILLILSDWRANLELTKESRAECPFLFQLGRSPYVPIFLVPNSGGDRNA